LKFNSGFSLFSRVPDLSLPFLPSLMLPISLASKTLRARIEISNCLVAVWLASCLELGLFAAALCRLARAWKRRTDKKRDLFDTRPCQADSRSCGKVEAHRLNQFQSRISRYDSIDHQQACPECLHDQILLRTLFRHHTRYNLLCLGGITHHSGYRPGMYSCSMETAF
jgi:hypothetical protein